MKLRKVLGTLLFIGLLVISAVVYIYQQEIKDWWFLRSYDPDAMVIQIADDVRLTEEGRRLFYLSDPQILDKTTFNENCVFAEFDLVVGCYDGGRIYLLDIEEPLLEGGELVTAAHEMLHAAYQRLSSSERQQLGDLLQAEIDRSSDQDLLERVNLYRQADSDSIDNELHSLLGSETQDLPPELEEYYQRYFLDRNIITSVAAEYNRAFDTLENEAQTMLATIETLNSELLINGTDLENRSNYLQNEKEAIEQLRSTDQMTTLAQRIESYNQAVLLYNRDVRQYQTLIDQYENLVSSYKEITLRYADLVNSIDSHYQAIGIE